MRRSAATLSAPPFVWAAPSAGASWGPGPPGHRGTRSLRWHQQPNSLRQGRQCFFFGSDSRVPRKCTVRRTRSCGQSKYNIFVPCDLHFTWPLVAVRRIFGLWIPAICVCSCRGCRNGEKKKLGVSNTPYDGGYWVTDGGWCVTDGGWWVATKHQRVYAIVKKQKRVSVLMAPPVQLYFAATPWGLAQNPKKKVINLRSVCGDLSVLFCGYREKSLLGILVDMAFFCRKVDSHLWAWLGLCPVVGSTGWPKKSNTSCLHPQKTWTVGATRRPSLRQRRQCVKYQTSNAMTTQREVTGAYKGHQVLDGTDVEGGGDLIKKTDKCKPEVMHSTVRHKCIFIFSMPNLVEPQDTHCV